MKTSLFLLILAFCLAVSSSLAQDRIDVIHLKNGDILKGTIIENVPNDYVRIELQGGSVFTVKYVDILKFTKEKQSADVQTLQRPTKTEPSGIEDVQKMMYYEKDKKSSGTAVLLSLVITSAGHAYAGNWGRGLLFTAGRVGGAVLALTAGIETNTYSSGGYYYSYSYSETKITTWYYVGFGAILVFAIWEAIDASAEVDRYNENLYNKIMGKKPFGFNIVPSKNGTQLQFTYNF
jgi:hypothetical protein